VRYDINPVSMPHVVGSITDLHEIQPGAVHAIYISHCLEHVAEVEAWRAVQEMIRVLHPDGFVICEVPNLTKACQMIVEGGIMETAYWSGAGPIRPVDMLYGFQPMIAEKGGQYMTHRFGYTQESLGALFHRCGFGDITIAETENGWGLTCLAFVKEKDRGKDVG